MKAMFYKSLKRWELTDFLILFLPISILIGNFWINSTSILIIILGLKSFHKNFYNYQRNNKIIILSLLLLLVFNIIFSMNYLETLRSAGGLIKYILLSFILYFWFSKDENNFKTFLISIFFSLIIVGISIYLEFLYKEFNNFKYDRLSGIFFEEKIAGSFIVKLLFPILLYLYIYYRKFYLNNYILFLVILLSIFTVILSGDRSPMIMISFTLTIFILFNKKFNITQKIKSLIYALLFFSLIYYSFENVRHKIQYTFDQLGIDILAKSFFVLDQKISKKNKVQGSTFEFAEDAVSYEEYKFSTQNTIKRNFLESKWGAHFITAFEIGKKNIILGSGMKTFKTECNNDKYLNLKINQGPPEYRCATHPHNIYFEIFSETGLLGLLIFLYIHLKILKKIINTKDENLKIILISIMIILFFPLQTTGSYFSSFNGIFYFINLPIIFFITNKYHNIKKSFN